MLCKVNEKNKTVKSKTFNLHWSAQIETQNNFWYSWFIKLTTLDPTWGLPLKVKYKSSIKVNISLLLRNSPTVAKREIKLEVTYCITKMAYSKKTQKTFFVNNFCAPELWTLKFVARKKIVVTQIVVASLFQNFHLRKSYVKKISAYL